MGPFLVAKESLILIVFFLSGMMRMEDYGNKVRIKVLHCHMPIINYILRYSFFNKIRLYISIQRTKNVDLCRCTDYFYLHERVWNGCLILAQFCRTHLDL